MNTRLHQDYGSWAVVTGASDGLGKEFANQLAASGFNLVLVARRIDVLQRIATDLMARHRIQVECIGADLGNDAGVASVISKTQGMSIGLLVASAGFGSAGPLLDLDIHSEKSMVDVNCRAVLELSYHYGKLFKQQHRGGIILLSSLLAFQGAANTANYAATKAYVQTLAEGLAIEMKPHGIDVLSVAPGPINTGFAKQANMKFSMALTPETVVREALQSISKKTTLRPGGLSKLLELGLKSVVFRSLRVRMMSQVMKGMIDHG